MCSNLINNKFLYENVEANKVGLVACSYETTKYYMQEYYIAMN